MPYVLLIAGLLLAWLDYLGAGNIRAAISLFKEEVFDGTPPFWKWLGAIIIVGLLGYVDDLKPIAQALLTLILVVMLLSHKSSFSQIVNKL